MQNNNSFDRDLKTPTQARYRRVAERKAHPFIFRFLVAAGLLVGVSWLATFTIASIPTSNSPVSSPSTAEFTPTPPQQVIVLTQPDGTSLEEVTPAAVRPAAHQTVATDGKDDSTPAVAQVTIRRGDTLSTLFTRLGIGAGAAFTISRDPKANPLNDLVPGRTLTISKNADGTLQKLTYRLNPVDSLTVQPVTGGGYAVEQHQRQFDTRLRYVSGTIDSSLFEAGQAAGLSDNQIMGLVEIFGWDVDFALDLRRGDSFAVIVEEKYWQGIKIAEGPIMAAEFVNRGHRFRAVRFVDNHGEAEYYTPAGRNLRRAFLRTPVKFTRISSRFSLNRYHPILHRRRPHLGVDYAAPIGTPVRATANGRVVFAGRKGGFGNVIILKHAGVFSTVYGHLSRFHRGVHRGVRVKQGEVIGYVGMTGLATGPHLHYEFRVNGVHRNPLTVKLPQAAPIAARYRTRFLSSARTWSARLDLLDGSRVKVASNP